MIKSKDQSFSCLSSFFSFLDTQAHTTTSRRGREKKTFVPSLAVFLFILHFVMKKSEKCCISIPYIILFYGILYFLFFWRYIHFMSVRRMNYCISNPSLYNLVLSSSLHSIELENL